MCVCDVMRDLRCVCVCMCVMRDVCVMSDLRCVCVCEMRDV